MRKTTIVIIDNEWLRITIHDNTNFGLLDIEWILTISSISCIRINRKGNNANEIEIQGAFDKIILTYDAKQISQFRTDLDFLMHLLHID